MTDRDRGEPYVPYGPYRAVTCRIYGVKAPNRRPTTYVPSPRVGPYVVLWSIHTFLASCDIVHHWQGRMIEKTLTSRSSISRPTKICYRGRPTDFNSVSDMLMPPGAVLRGFRPPAPSQKSAPYCPPPNELFVVCKWEENGR